MLTPLHYGTFAAGFALAGALAGVGGWAYDNLIDDPAIVRETKKTCAAEAAAAAMEATLAQWQRSKQKIDELTRDFNELTRRRAAEDAQIDRETRDEIAAFASKCPVTADNIEFLWPG